MATAAFAHIQCPSVSPSFNLPHPAGEFSPLHYPSACSIRVMVILRSLSCVPQKDSVIDVQRGRPLLTLKVSVCTCCPVGLSGAMANVSVRSGAPGSPSHTGSNSASARRRSSLQDVDLNSFIAEEMARHLESSRKRAPAQCNDVITEPPSHKRSRML